MCRLKVIRYSEARQWPEIEGNIKYVLDRERESREIFVDNMHFNGKNLVAFKAPLTLSNVLDVRGTCLQIKVSQIFMSLWCWDSILDWGWVTVGEMMLLLVLLMMLQHNTLWLSVGRRSQQLDELSQDTLTLIITAHEWYQSKPLQVVITENM